MRRPGIPRAWIGGSDCHLALWPALFDAQIVTGFVGVRATDKRPCHHEPAMMWSASYNNVARHHPGMSFVGFSLAICLAQAKVEYMRYLVDREHKMGHERLRIALGPPGRISCGNRYNITDLTCPRLLRQGYGLCFRSYRCVAPIAAIKKTERNGENSQTANTQGDPDRE